MRNQNKNQKFQKEASALLVSIVLTSVLLVLGLAANQVIIREIRAQYESSQSMQAYYSAEAGMEDALYAVNNNIPGYQVTKQVDLNNDSKIDYNLNLVARSSTLPCKQDGQEWFSVNVQDSLRVPLFVSDDKGSQVDVKDFAVNFYVDRPAEITKFVASTQDVLKWSIIGTNSNGDTESIQDYVPLQSDNSSASQPSALGTLPDIADKYTTAKFYSKDSSGTYHYYDTYSIKTFLQNHTNNYLTLQNVIDLNDPDLGTFDTPEYNKINIKLVNGTSAETYVCPTTLIQSDGFGHNVKESIDAKYKAGTFLPAFDFALFQYDGGK